MKQKIYNTGLVIGKFYPPHLGHKFLIDTAKKSTKELYVLVCDDDRQLISAKKRADWLQKIHPDVKVKIIEDIKKDDDSFAWAEHTKKFLGFVPEAVFSSEDYGVTYSKYLCCEHVMVDKNRININISATKIRNNLQENLKYLHPVVQEYFVPRIVVLGAESTGTTTLSKELAKHYQTNWVPEFGRIYSESLQNVWTYDWTHFDFEFIAKTQNNLEDHLARTANKFLICDTDSFATTLWQERYMGKISYDVGQIAKNNDLYILTGDEIPFVQDGTRDGQDIRHQMHNKFVEKLNKEKKNWILVTGDREKRFEKAVLEINNLLEKRFLKS